LFRRTRYQQGSLNLEERKKRSGCMGLPVVGKGHRRKVRSQETANRRYRRILHRIGSASSGRCSSANHQQSLPTQKYSQNDGRQALGTLHRRGTSSERSLDPGCVHDRCKEMDSTSVGPVSAGRGENRRGGALAAGNGSSKRNTGQDQERDVGLVFARGPLGILQSQSDFVGTPSWHGRQARSERWRAYQCQTRKSAPGPVSGAGQTGLGRAAVPGPTPGVSHRGTGYAKRGGWSTSLGGLRSHQPNLRCPTLLLLAEGRVPEGDQDGGFSETLADASCIEKRPCRVESPELVCNRIRFRVSVGTQEGEEAARPRRGVETIDPAGVREARNHGGWVAYISAFGGQHVGRYGRASAHHPRLLASQQLERHQPVLAGDIEHQASRPGEASRCDRAERIAVCKQIKSDSVNSPRQIVCASRQRSVNAFCFGVGALIGPKRTQILRRGSGQLIERYGRHEETRTPDLYRVKVAL
jgi:hypothetical protein